MDCGSCGKEMTATARFCAECETSKEVLIRILSDEPGMNRDGCSLPNPEGKRSPVHGLCEQSAHGSIPTVGKQGRYFRSSLKSWGAKGGSTCRIRLTSLAGTSWDLNVRPPDAVHTAGARAGWYGARTGLVVVLVAVLSVACTSGSGGSTPTPNVATVEPAPAPATSDDALPAELVGAWSSSGDATEIAYRFVADGRYRSAEILSQLRSRGIFEFTVVSEGRARVDGDFLILQPTTVTSTRKDPQSPEEDYNNRPMPLTERMYGWRVDGSVLRLRDAEGRAFALARQP